MPRIRSFLAPLHSRSCMHCCKFQLETFRTKMLCSRLTDMRSRMRRSAHCAAGNSMLPPRARSCMPVQACAALLHSNRQRKPGAHAARALAGASGMHLRGRHRQQCVQAVRLLADACAIPLRLRSASQRACARAATPPQPRATLCAWPAPSLQACARIASACAARAARCAPHIQAHHCCRLTES